MPVATLDELLDRQAIVDVAVAYCWALDSRDWDGLDTVFTPDAHAELGRSVDGVEAIKARVREALEPLEVSQHLVGNHEVRLDGDRATARCYFHAQHVRDLDGERQLVVAGRYEDELMRTSDGWRISRRDLTVLWIAGDPAVLGL